MARRRLRLWLTTWVLVVPGCAEPAPAPPPTAERGVPDPNPDPIRTPDGLGDEHTSLDAVTWMQLSAEYEIIATSTYADAKRSLDQALADATWTASPEQTGDFAEKTPAVILDVDETVLDNSPYATWRIKNQQPFESESWTRWCNAAQADPIPGALDFTQYAAAKGVTVFYVTNRDADTEKGTLQNLLEHGFPVDPEGERLMLRGERPDWETDKGTRRRAIGENHRILLLIGDNLGDFVDGAKASAQARASMVEANAENWGKRWFMLPNPDYGSWEDPILTSKKKLSASQQTRKKLEALRAWDG